jgi:cytochrome c5
MSHESDWANPSTILFFHRACLSTLVVAGALSLPATAQNQYVGVKVCASCHGGELAGGKAAGPYQIWQKSMHAGAVRTLASKDVAGEARQVEGLWIVKMGRGEKYGLPVPAADFPHCLICHSTAVSADPRLVSESLDRKEGVQCESCHGPGSAHARVETLKRSGKPIPAEEVAAALDVAKAVTLRRYANEKEVEAMCRTCHDGMCGDFDFQKAWPAVRHSKPSKPEAAKSGGARSGR